MNNQLPTSMPLPWTQAQFDDMKKFISDVIPQMEDMLNRAEKSGHDVKQQRETLAAQKKQIQSYIDNWKDKYK